MLGYKNGRTLYNTGCFAMTQIQTSNNGSNYNTIANYDDALSLQPNRPYLRPNQFITRKSIIRIVEENEGVNIESKWKCVKKFALFYVNSKNSYRERGCRTLGTPPSIPRARRLVVLNTIRKTYRFETDDGLAATGRTNRTARRMKYARRICRRPSY